MYADSLISLFMCFSGLNVLGFVLYLPNMLGIILYISDSKCDINFSQNFLSFFLVSLWAVVLLRFVCCLCLKILLGC